MDVVIKKTCWFTSGLPTNRGVEYNEFVSAVVATTNYFIWTAKLQKNSLPVDVMLIDLDWKVRNVGCFKKINCLKTKL